MRPVSPEVHGLSQVVPWIFTAKVLLFPYFGFVAAIRTQVAARRVPAGPFRRRPPSARSFRTASPRRSTWPPTTCATPRSASWRWPQRSRSRRGAHALGSRTRSSAGSSSATAGEPLGELRMARNPAGLDPVHGPLGTRSAPACTSRAGTLRIARRPALPADPRGDLLQAGPLLVHARRAGDARRTRPRGLFRRQRAVRLRHHGRAPPARRARRRRRHRAVAAVCDGRSARRCRPVASASWPS